VGELRGVGKCENCMVRESSVSYESTKGVYSCLGTNTVSRTPRLHK